MINLMTYTYLFDIKKIKKCLDNYWKEYSKIINNKKSTFEDLNRARAILFLVSNYYCEQVAPFAIEKRTGSLKTKLTLSEFLEAVDKKKDKKYLSDPKFKKIKEYYLLIKDFKNSHVINKRYHNEEKFLEEYNKKRPAGTPELKF
ncbi:MAG: hypothetical protein PHH82_02350 [Candidatus ainarchaeum sp.]|nr:hypothetical protein [Candidatus ainarchaeum sp.]